jgi:D-amino peptidase
VQNIVPVLKTNHAKSYRFAAKRSPRSPADLPKEAPVKLFIAIDLEGICGVVSEEDTEREGAAAQRARAHMRADLDAVLEGCASAGAGDVVVCDAHDDGRNLDPAGLPHFVRLVSGSPTPGSLLEGLTPDRDGALFVGYHARAGSLAAVLEHTWSYKVYAVSVGGLEIGEFGVAALLAGEMGVPVLYVSGDDKIAAEAAALAPGVIATVVKTGVRREAATFVPPDVARARMSRDVEAALTAEARPAPPAWSGDPLRLTFTRVEFCDLAEACPGAQRLDGRTLEIGGARFAEVYRGFLACLRLAEATD